MTLLAVYLAGAVLIVFVGGLRLAKTEGTFEQLDLQDSIFSFALVWPVILIIAAFVLAMLVVGLPFYGVLKLGQLLGGKESE